ncbi:MAG TPA: Ca2+-dependent phosphoinositide-specific phospholipase C, partial [Acidimicrobiales bacterium]
LDQVRGQVMFMLDDHGAKRDAYRAQLPDLADREIFVDVPETDPDAAVMVVNDPLGDGDRIRDLVSTGFIVRTRADADTVQARTGDTSMRDAAFASGAQYVSTDYVFPEDPFHTGYTVDLPGDTPARCNPVNAPRQCPRVDLSG